MLQLTDDVSTSTLFKIAQPVKVNYQDYIWKAAILTDDVETCKMLYFYY